jgi:CubicO group peptidase (beta-lactamase class C family)
MKTIFLIGLFIFIASPLNAAERVMQERYNVGGYIKVGPTTPYRFEPNRNPRALPLAGAQELSQRGNADAINNAKAFMVKFPETTSMLLMERGKIVFEAYQGMGNKLSEFYGMSISKSMTSLAVGKALCNGVLKNIDTLASDYVPELKINRYGQSSIRQLLTMSSGAYLAIQSGQPKFTNGIGLRRKTGAPYSTGPWPLRLGQVTVGDILWGAAWAKVENKNHAEPGQVFAYKAGDTLSLGKVIENAAGMSLAAYFDKYVWQDVGAAQLAHWESDREGTTRGNAGFQASLRDWGRIAVWLMTEIKKPGCYGDYLRQATTTQIKNERQGAVFKGYGYQWWTDNRFAPGFWGRGYAGQELAINPSSGKILIKFGYRIYKGIGAAINKLYRDWHIDRRAPISADKL